MTTQMFKFEVGKIPERYVRLPRFMVSLHRKSFAYAPVTILGRLYHGYVGALILRQFRGEWYEFTVWIHNMEKEMD